MSSRFVIISLVNIGGLADFYSAKDHDVTRLLRKLQKYYFEVNISKGQDTIDEIQVEYISKETGKRHFEYRIENLISVIYLSSKTGVSIVGILIIQIISLIVNKSKTLYKAIILDLDETLWKGTLAEDGIDAIKQDLHADESVPFIMFMRFIQAMAKELGLYVAICSRNDADNVLSAIDKLSDKEFPLKDHIDCIVANYNNKSKNIKAIAQKLSILTNACVFIDDNPLVRDEVRQNLPELFVPEWDTHEELLNLFMACCIFDRFELSLKSRNRKRLYKIIRQEREKSYLPQLFIKVCEDINHLEAIRLYAKSNQFKFAEHKETYKNCKSMIFEIYRDNGENLGICSAVTYTEDEQEVHVLNWAISCRYFEIGLEEYILMYICALSGRRSIRFSYNETGFNGKVAELIDKYKSCLKKDDADGCFYLIPDIQSKRVMKLNTNLKEYCNE